MESRLLDMSVRDGGPVSGPFATRECLRVIDGCCLPFSTEVTTTVPSYESFVVEARFSPNCNFVGVLVQTVILWTLL